MTMERDFWIWNLTDHLMINGKWRRSSLRDVRVRRGADVGCDHYVATDYVRLKPKTTGKRNKGRSHYDVDKLKDPHKKLFVLHLCI